VLFIILAELRMSFKAYTSVHCTPVG